MANNLIKTENLVKLNGEWALLFYFSLDFGQLPCFVVFVRNIKIGNSFEDIKIENLLKISLEFVFYTFNLYKTSNTSL